MKLWLPLLLIPVVAMAEDDVWSDETWEDEWDSEEQGQAWAGFVEAGFGTRFSRDPLLDSRSTLEDFRWRLETDWRSENYLVDLKADVGYDGVEAEWYGDLRNLSIGFTIGESIDARFGRQVQTWGTGDLVFLNDLFPKDFVSFFSGRDDEYLKAPGDVIRLTRYSPAINIDFVWSPVFQPDRYLDGERFSFFSPLTGSNVAPRPALDPIEPDESLSNSEFALRLFRTIEGKEYALYAYRGFFKQPNALTPALEATFAPMTAVGASLRRPLGPGLFNLEASWYLSRDDEQGNNPLLPNDQLRFLAGYEWEAKPNFTVGLQYYLEVTLDYDDLIAGSAFPALEPEEFRHLLTNRLTYRAGMDRFTWSLFTFYSPSDQDAYLRPQFTYRHSDYWSVLTGFNLFRGNNQHSFFGQFEDASNAWLRLRFSY